MSSELELENCVCFEPPLLLSEPELVVAEEKMQFVVYVNCLVVYNIVSFRISLFCS